IHPSPGSPLRRNNIHSLGVQVHHISLITIVNWQEGCLLTSRGKCINITAPALSCHLIKERHKEIRRGEIASFYVCRGSAHVKCSLGWHKSCEHRVAITE